MIDKNASKKEQIIKTAMQLFAVKGSSSTSMQEIAELCGISKGSLYLVFKSKEELERSIYIYCFRMIRDPLQKEEQEIRRTPREKLRNQIEILLSHVYELREFLQRQIQEFAGKDGMDIPEWLRKNNGLLLLWFQNKLKNMYGEEILPYTGDLALFANGMIASYLKVIFIREAPVSIPHIADHLVDLMDILVAGLLASRPTPLISAAMLSGWVENSEEGQRHNPLQLIKMMKSRLGSDSGLNPDDLEDALESLTILESEILIPQPRKAIINGMLHNLQHYSILAGELTELKVLISPYMQHSCGLHAARSK